MSLQNSFFEIAVILGLATLLGVAGQKLRQPLLIMFLATGILVGPSCLGVVESHSKIELLAHIGVALLLFIVGLRLDFHLIRTTGAVSLATGLGQIAFTSLISFTLAAVLGIPLVSAAYVAVAMSFSSTIIIVKLLSDKKEIGALHGQIAIGFLIVQDIAAILALVALATFGSSTGTNGSFAETSFFIAAKGLGLLAAVALLTRFVVPPLARYLAQSQELLALFAIAWAVLLGTSSELLGFTKEVGAFLAGISLASTPYRDAIGARLTTLRDFLLLFFFIDLGARLEWSTVGSQVGKSLVFSLLVLVGNPIIVLAIMGRMGYRRRTGFLAGLTVAQISEFSLIIAAMGMSVGHIPPETMGLITLVSVITIFASTYMILYSGPLYEFLSGPLRVFERRVPHRETRDSVASDEPVDVILLGLGNYGSELAEHLWRRGKTIIGVDFDPSALDRWRARGMPVLFSDIGDPELLDQLPLGAARWVASTAGTRDLNLALANHLRDAGFEGRIALRAADPDEAASYEKSGVDVVLRPFVDAAESAADAVTHATEFLPKRHDWPIDFREIRIRSDVTAAGKTLRDLPLRSKVGVSVLAVGRGGRVTFDPDPDFQILPGDRVVVAGPFAELEKAESVLSRSKSEAEQEPDERFEIAEIRLADDSAESGRTLAESEFKAIYGVTVVGIQRRGEWITSLSPDTRLEGGDTLLIVGTADAVGALGAGGVV